MWRTSTSGAGAIPAIAYADYNGDGLIDIFYSPSDGSRSPVAEMYINDGMGGARRGSSDRTRPVALQGPAGRLQWRRKTGCFRSGPRLRPRYRFPVRPHTRFCRRQCASRGTGQHHRLPSRGASADIDADGDLDVFVTENFKGPFFLINDGAHMRDTVRIDGIGAEGIFTAELVDVDHDGYVDLLAAGHEYEALFLRILWGNSSGVFSPRTRPSSPRSRVSASSSHRRGRTDADGDKDIVLIVPAARPTVLRTAA